MAVQTIEAHSHISLPSGWGATGGSAPADDANANTVSPSNYLSAHDNIRYQYLDADMAAKSDTALADIFSVSVVASGIYVFEYTILWVVTAATTGISIAMNGPASPTSIAFGAIASISLAAAGGGGLVAYESKITTAGSLVAGNMAQVSGMLENGSNAGNLALRYSPEVAASLTVKRGSWGRILKLN